MIAAALIAASLLAAPVYAVTAQKFAPAGSSPTAPSGNYTGPSNGTAHFAPVVPGKAFDRFIQIWLENTDYQTAASTAQFQKLAAQGLLLTAFHAVTHPSQPNYLASVGGDFFGLGDDSYYNIPANISTVVDLLEAKHISWAAYAESMPTDASDAFYADSKNYLDPSAPDYSYYVRKHNPLVIYDSVGKNASRMPFIRNFNDFANDMANATLPQWMFVTPNMVNDGHDTDINFVGAWLDYWLTPLLADPKFNDNKTLILLTFDENETYEEANVIYTVLLGGALPKALVGKNDSTFYTHYSALASVQANWGLGSLGRQDTNATVSNVFQFVADATGHTNANVTAPPPLNRTGDIPGPLNGEYFQPFAAPNASAKGAGGGPVFAAPALNASVTPATLPAPVNVTDSPFMNVSAMGGPDAPAPASNTSGGASPSAGAGGKSGARALDARAALGAVAGAVAGAVLVL